MNTPAKPAFAISANYLGPVFSLDGELTKNAQNLIFARNGTGKSFLSRAFRYLDIHRQGKPLDDAARNLVSDESPDGKGAFSYARGSDIMGSLSLDKTANKAIPILDDTIFHVFSAEFVQEELREQEYNPDGQIENQIAVDSANIELQDAQKALEQALSDEQDAARALNLTYDSEKDIELIDKADIRRQLKEYRALSFEGVLAKFPQKPSSPHRSISDILRDLDSLKAIPSEPSYPQSIDPVEMVHADMAALARSLARATSPSSVSEDIKKKIETHHDFYKTGIAIVSEESREQCPFCEQDIASVDPNTLIQAYITYFADEEEKHKSELRLQYSNLKTIDNNLTQLATLFARQKSRYDSLKHHLPSMRGYELVDTEPSLELVNEAVAAIKAVIEEKEHNLDAAYTLPEEDLFLRVDALNETIVDNNAKVDALNAAIERSDQERKSLQRSACLMFEHEFVVRNWSSIETLYRLRNEAKSRRNDLVTLEKSAPTSDARSRVAETFELLLQVFFAEKYVFNTETFTLKRGGHEMLRGPHRTLSDGEKTAIAFCYFVACVHRKVSSNSDYQKLFLVFDDPVTSMSYEYIFVIAQTLKNINISNQGQVSVNPGLIDGNKYIRPELLILTHSSYFFNISVTNRVVNKNAAFALIAEKDKHVIAHLEKYVAPFQAQLKDIYDIAHGGQADHTTANAIRSVLEAIGRFCRPDKSESLSTFVQHLAGEEDISVRSTLINSLCHGTYYEETVPPDELRLACEETLAVVKRYAAGQLEMLKNPS